MRRSCSPQQQPEDWRSEMTSAGHRILTFHQASRRIRFEKPPAAMAPVTGAEGPPAPVGALRWDPVFALSCLLFGRRKKTVGWAWAWHEWQAVKKARNSRQHDGRPDQPVRKQPRGLVFAAAARICSNARPGHQRALLTAAQRGLGFPSCARASLPPRSLAPVPDCCYLRGLHTR